MMVVMGANASNFQQVLNASKSFVVFTGFTYDCLLKNKATVFLPKIIDSEHEAIVKRYLKKQKDTEYRVALTDQWLKTSNEALKPVSIQVIPRIDLDKGIVLVALIQKQTHMELFEQVLKTSQVFCVMTDANYRVVHCSQNSIDMLGFVEFISQHDLSLQLLFNGLPDELVSNTVYTCLLDTSPLLVYRNNTEEQQHKVYSVKVHYTEKRFRNDSTLCQLLFAVLSAIDSTSL